MVVNGYKAFNGDMTNINGFKFEEGKTYHIDGPISFGVNGNGFHMCKRMEDTFRYVDDCEKKVAEVTGFGSIAESFDDYYGYYDMYSVSDIKINHILIRDEVIKKILQSSENSVIRFIITGFKMTDEEIYLIRNKFKNSYSVNEHLDYYALGKKDAFSAKYKKLVR